jgi:acyl-CoA reductase-like NAD-dependent aldehyde dehydrogenase
MAWLLQLSRSAFLSHESNMQGCSRKNRVSIEAGGNAAFIVFNDADVSAAVEGKLHIIL